MNIGQSENIEQCGFCGRYFIGNTYIEEKKVDKSQRYPLGYCPDAHYEDPSNDGEVRYVTRDMAIDACDLSLEGMRL